MTVTASMAAEWVSQRMDGWGGCSKDHQYSPMVYG